MWFLFTALSMDPSLTGMPKTRVHLMFAGVTALLLIPTAIGCLNKFRGRRREKWADAGRCGWCGSDLGGKRGPCSRCGWPIVGAPN
jgi:hypothetical protein